MPIRILPNKKISARQSGGAALRCRTQTMGFTLIELMIVVAIIAVLAGLAYPSYTRHVIETRRADGKAGILQLATQLERYFTQCGSYTQQITGGTISGCTGLNNLDDKSPGQNYQLSIQTGPTGTITTSYQISAAPIGAQANDADCQTLWLQSTNVRGQTGPNTQGRCWRQ